MSSFFTLPLWLLVVALTAAAIYFLDYLPLQHYWNPRVRLLYPYRQWRVERLLLKTLYNAGIIRRNRLPPLPFEIWGNILDKAIDIPFFFDTACDPKYFHLLMRYQFSRGHIRGYSESERDRKAFLLVCKSWYSMMSRRNERYIVDKQSCTEGTRRVIRDPFWHGYSDLGASQEKITNITSIAIYSNSRNVQSMEEDCHFLFQHANNFPFLRSFTYYGSEVPLSPSSLKEIEHSFLSLTILILNEVALSGSLTLPALEVLSIDCKLFDLTGWWFPRLIHMEFGENVVRQQGYETSLVPGPVHAIQSLLLPYKHPDLEADDTFWNDHSSLIFLDVSISHFMVTNTAPTSHPLRYLHIAESAASLQRINIQHFSDITNQIPNLRLISMSVIKNPYQDMYPPDWMSLFMKHQRRGLIWRDKDGVAIKFRERKRNYFPLWALLYLFVQVAAIIWYFWATVDRRIGWLLPFPTLFVVSYIIWEISKTPIIIPHVPPLDNRYLM